MTVTKQQQLEWLAKNRSAWDFYLGGVMMSVLSIGVFCGETPACPAWFITREEWQQERDKMSSKPEVDNSLRKRGARPPIGAHVELWFGGSFSYNCEFICARGMNYIVWNLDADRPDCADIMNSEFRPLRTEREKAIDAACVAVGGVGEDGLLIIERLYDAGMLK